MYNSKVYYAFVLAYWPHIKKGDAHAFCKGIFLVVNAAFVMLVNTVKFSWVQLLVFILRVRLLRVYSTGAVHNRPRNVIAVQKRIRLTLCDPVCERVSERT